MPIIVSNPMPVVVSQHQDPMVCTERFVDGIRQFYCVPEVGHVSPTVMIGVIVFIVLMYVGMFVYIKRG